MSTLAREVLFGLLMDLPTCYLNAPIIDTTVFIKLFSLLNQHYTIMFAIRKKLR